MTQEQAKQELIEYLKTQPNITGVNIDIKRVADSMLQTAIKELKEENTFDRTRTLM
jgi:hypothetical protein